MKQTERQAKMGDQAYRTMNDQRTARRRMAAAVIVSGVVMLGVAVAPGVASAHRPVVSGTTSCRVDSWTVTWTAVADADRNLNWKINAPAGYAPSGFHDDQTPMTRTITYPGTLEVAVETVSAEWSNGFKESASGSVPRPALCQINTTSTTSTTTTVVDDTTTTTLADTTTSLGQEVPTTTTTALATTTSLGQQGPTTTVGQTAGATTTTVGQAAAATTTTVGSLPATGGGGGSLNLTVVALTLIGVGAVMLRLVSQPSR